MRISRTYGDNPFLKIIAHSPAGEDPPDCEAEDYKGNLIGIEVTELVEGQSIANARQNKLIPMEPWKTEKLDSTIGKRIKRKDTPHKVNGGPYSE